MLHSPIAKVREVNGQIGDDLQQLVEFLGSAPGEIVCGEQVEGSSGDSEIITPDQEFAEFRRSCPMPVGCRLEQSLLGPAAIAVQDHGDVLRQFLA